jgi:U4/U6 small nuclear ribonucleoprotein PRP3
LRSFKIPSTTAPGEAAKQGKTSSIVPTSALLPKFASVSANVVTQPIAPKNIPKKDRSLLQSVSKDKVERKPFFDRKIASVSRQKERIGLKFVEKGSIVKKAEEARAKAQIEALKEQLELAKKKSGIQDELELVPNECIPTNTSAVKVEWWDVQFLSNNDYSSETVYDQVTDLVQHPALIEPEGESHVPPKMLMLTLQERKKARRLRRLQAQKDKQEKISLGLLPPEQPKAKISNMMNIFGKQAISDPTKIEQIVQDQIKGRLEAHLKHNEDAKLTKEEKRDKMIKKYKEDTSNGVSVAVFKVVDLSNPSHKFKVEMNAKQNYLTGICVLNSGCNLVIVEGGPKGVQRYKNLMLRRIEWSNEDSPENRCHLLWEGQVAEPCFSSFDIFTYTTEEKVKQALGASFLHFWDTAKSIDKFH